MTAPRTGNAETTAHLSDLAVRTDLQHSVLLGRQAANLEPARHEEFVSGATSEGERMIIFGIILFIIGLVATIPILETIGIILVVVGAVLFLLGSMGRAVGGRRHYW
jgi:hypothetical protein